MPTNTSHPTNRPDHPEEQSDAVWTLEQLAERTGVPRRTIRYYIQLGLVPRPHGERRGALYGEEHLDRVLEVRRLAQQGFSLTEIAEARQKDRSDTTLPERPVGTIDMRAHISLGAGIELVVDRSRAALTSPEIEALAKAVIDAFATVRNPER